jgi:hypothetical protein
LEDCSGNVKDSGEPDLVAGEAQQHAVQDLPDETLVFLFGSRYWETDRLSDIAWSLFGNTPPGGARVQAIWAASGAHLPLRPWGRRGPG